MQYQGCLLVVKDVQKSKAFYQTLFGCTTELDLEDYVIFKQGIMLQQQDTWLSFIKKQTEALCYQHHTAELYFEEENLDNFVGQLSITHPEKIINPITEHEWGQRSIRFYDLDQHVIEVGESMSVVIKRYLKMGMSIEQTAEKSMFPIAFVEACFAELNKG